MPLQNFKIQQYKDSLSAKTNPVYNLPLWEKWYCWVSSESIQHPLTGSYLQKDGNWGISAEYFDSKESILEVLGSNPKLPEWKCSYPGCKCSCH